MSHYYSARQESPFLVRKIDVILRGQRFSFFTGAGVFSKKKVDYGTKVLAEFMEISENDRVLDMGCGIGILGRVAATLTRNEIVLVDVNVRALALAKKNMQGIERVRVFKSDAYEALTGERFHVILLNPPQTAGKKLCLRMIAEAQMHLYPQGCLQLVARHNVGGETFSKYMKDVFGNVQTLVRKGGYRIYMSVFHTVEDV